MCEEGSHGWAWAEVDHVGAQHGVYQRQGAFTPSKGLLCLFYIDTVN